jgi:hypothetical protein
MAALARIPRPIPGAFPLGRLPDTRPRVDPHPSRNATPARPASVEWIDANRCIPSGSPNPPGRRMGRRHGRLGGPIATRPSLRPASSNPTTPPWPRIQGHNESPGASQTNNRCASLPSAHPTPIPRSPGRRMGRCQGAPRRPKARTSVTPDPLNANPPSVSRRRATLSVYSILTEQTDLG